MLTIQPKFTTQAYNAGKIPFKGEGFSVETTEDKLYDEKTKYYEKQKNEFEKLKKDVNASGTFKTILSGFSTISSALFEGWMVAWGASKGAKFLKGSVINGVNSKVAKGASEAAAPVLKGVGKFFSKIGTKVSELVGKVKTSPLATKISEKLTKVAEKMDNTKLGKPVMTALRAVGKAIKAVMKFIAKPFEKLAAKLKGADISSTYDKVAKTTSTTLGVGAGTAEVYNKVMHPENAKISEDAKEDANEEIVDETPVDDGIDEEDE